MVRLKADTTGDVRLKPDADDDATVISWHS